MKNLHKRLFMLLFASMPAWATEITRHPAADEKAQLDPASTDDDTPASDQGPPLSAQAEKLLEEVTKYTKDYLAYMREKVQEILDADGGLLDAYKIDQSPFAHLDTFFELSRSNAGQIFRAMEFE